MGSKNKQTPKTLLIQELIDIIKVFIRLYIYNKTQRSYDIHIGIHALEYDHITFSINIEKPRHTVSFKTTVSLGDNKIDWLESLDEQLEKHVK